MTRLRILLVSLLVASCAGQSPLAPTDSRVGLGSQSADPHAVIAAHDIEPNELSTESDDLTSESDDLTTESDDLSTVPDDLSAAVAKTFTLSGVITDKSYSAWKISSATVTVTPGPLVAQSTSAGKSASRCARERPRSKLLRRVTKPQPLEKRCRRPQHSPRR